ncbi:srv-28 [Pristionchus pacificus]|uniref:Srv-28 n=1 Tax=Pristionchus pacificus TaxID=54126 RepID=A0A2A6C444_PRIPA|nr:srv-28 [Pristionchus pacificus]|eukprot:PDM72877.1 srv-28 [Pristionchus pacificus]
MIESIIELFFIYAYVFGQMVFKDLIFGEEFALNTGYIYPTFAYYGTYYYILHVQVWGSVILSISRYVTVCRPLSKAENLFDRVRTPVLWMINTIVPLLLMGRMLFQGSVYYYCAPSGQVSQYTPLYIVKTNSAQGMIVSVIGSGVCAVCYFLVIRRLASTQKHIKGGLRDYRREKMLTIVGFAIFIALCISTLFYVLICINAANENAVAVNLIRTYYIYALMALTFVNPWMLIITNKNTRRRMLFQDSNVSTPIMVSTTINEIVMVSIYITCQLITRDHIIGEQFLFDSNGTIFPEFYFYGTHYYFMYVQVFGAILQSSNRFICVCIPFSRVHEIVEQIPAWVLLLTSFIVPSLPMIPMILRSRITFHRNLEGNIDLLIPTTIVQQNAIQGMVSTVFATILCSICYIVVITKLTRMKTDAHNARDFKREKMLTIVGFAVFISLCVETIYYIFLATMSGESVDRVRVFFVYPTVLMAFVNPWMLILTNQNVRNRALGLSAPSTTADNAVTIRTMATPISIIK